MFRSTEKKPCFISDVLDASNEDSRSTKDFHSLNQTCNRFASAERMNECEQKGQDTKHARGGSKLRAQKSEQNEGNRRNVLSVVSAQRSARESLH